MPQVAATRHVRHEDGKDERPIEEMSDVKESLEVISSITCDQRHGRASFVSLNEDREAVVQTFVQSKCSSYARRPSYESALDEAENCLNPTQHSWRILAKDRSALSTIAGSNTSVVSHSRLESLPPEVLCSIVDLLLLDIPPNGFALRNMDLMSLLLTSHALHSITLGTLYRQITIPHSRVFRKFLLHLRQNPGSGSIVRRLDFSHFNPTGAGVSAQERAETVNLTRTTLLQCLRLLPHLREFLAHEHIEEELSAEVIRWLLTLPRLQALDFCAASSSKFRDAMLDVFCAPSVLHLPSTVSLTRLSLHECTILPGLIYENLLSRLPALTHLDVAHTRITDRALLSIPATARLTHLNLSQCAGLNGSTVVTFLATHPAVRGIVYLNLMMDARSHEMLSACDLDDLLPSLPLTLKSLNLRGSSMRSRHLQRLEQMTTRLEELGLGRGLSYDDVASLLLRGGDTSPDSDTDPFGPEPAAPSSKHPSTLRYVDIADLDTAQIDMVSFFGRSTSILDLASGPLSVIEVSGSLYEMMKARRSLLRSSGWDTRDAGRRGWLVRIPGGTAQGKSRESRTGHLAVELDRVVDDGQRRWKMGASFWGMRKIPVARQEVGGMYGLYMFKR